MKFRTLSSTICFVIVVFSLSVPQVGQAQDEGGSLLPDISPQDIEIRGEFRARFVGLTRQPILGFDPEMQIYQIDPNRKPFMESGDQVVANLPVSELTRPAAPAYNALNYSEQINLFARAGVGSYTSPEINAWGVYHLNPGTYVGGDVDFSSSDGHLDRPSEFRFLTANGEFGTRLDDKTEMRIYAGLQSDFNYPASFSGEATPQLNHRIEHEGVNGGVELERFVNSISGWKLQGNIRSFSNTFSFDPIPTTDGYETFPGSIDEIVYNGSFSNRWALGNAGETLTIKAGTRGGTYEPQDSNSETWNTLQGGIAYERLFNYQTQVHAEADVFYITNAMEEQVYPGGVLQVDQWFGERLKVTGRVEGKPRLQTVEQLHERNRFLGYNNQLQHTYSVDVTAEASIKYYRGSKLHGGVTYTNATNYAYFSKNSLIGDDATQQLDVYQVNYRDATNFKLFAGITHQLLPERFWVTGQFYVQNPEFKNGPDVPFKENWGVNASVSARPIDRITIEGWADYVGDRETEVNAEETIDGFLLLGGQLDVEIIDNVGAYVKLVNILGQEYEVWEGYQERPFQVYGGLTLKF